MKIKLINKDKIIKITSHGGNSFVNISQYKIDKNVTMFIVSVRFRNKYSIAEHTNLVTAYNECVEDIYNQLPINYEYSERDDFILNVGVILKIVTK